MGEGISRPRPGDGIRDANILQGFQTNAQPAPQGMAGQGEEIIHGAFGAKISIMRLGENFRKVRYNASNFF
jgi:hypothetical protein